MSDTLGTVASGLLPTKSDASLARPVAQLAAEPALAEALCWFSREKKWINEKHLEVCRVPAPTFQEQKRAEWMVADRKSVV